MVLQSLHEARGPNRFWRWSCSLANTLRLRPYQGLENWPRWSELRRWISERGLVVEDHFGLHLFPFVLDFTHPFLRTADALGAHIGPVYVNQCVRARRPIALPPHQ